MTESNTRKQHPQHPSLFTGGAPHAWTVHHQTTQLHFGYNNNNDTTHNNSNATNDVTNDAAAARGWCAWGQSTLYVSSSSSSSTPTNASAAATKQQSHYHHSLALHLRRSCTVESIECRGIVVGVSSTNKLEKRKSSNNAAAASLGVLSCSFAHGDPMERVLVRSSGGNDQNTNPTNRSQNTAAKATGSVSWHAADAHSSRGAAGMTTGLRAASIASNGGELRLQIMDVVPNTNNNNHNTNSTTTSNSTAAREAVHALWLDDLQRHPGQGDEISSSNNKNHAARPSFLGAAEERLRHTLHQRAGDRRRQRLEWVARRMTDAAGAHAANGNETAAATAAQCGAAFKVTIRYRISGLDRDPASIVRLAGLQAIAPPWETDTVTSSAAGSRDRTMHSLPPHVYTVAGVYGDHEGPRCWMPVLDSAAVGHRASQLLSIAVTAPVAAGLSIVGMGEDAGVTETLLHDKSIWLPSSRCTATDAAGAGETELGEGIITVMATLQTGSACSLPRHLEESTTHVIPMDYSVDQTFVQQQQYKQNQQQQVCLDSIYATTIWCGQTWTPISCRSLGFSIGPFKVLDDPEYFGPSALDETNDDDDDDEESDGLNEMKSFEDRVSAFLEKSKANGEGVRQVYFAPRFEHKYIHTMPSTHVNMTLLPNTTFRLLPLSSHQKTVAIQLDQTVSAATTGVPHRALSLMRDVLAVPSFRSQSYTQVWIPNAVHGGCTSGALHNCPEVLVNPFLGGAIMDSRLLPPVGARLPFYQGGRVLQFLQARCAVRGWITAALPLGGNDDVGTGYIFAVFEALIMSLYERGHGGQGEGGARGGCFYSKRYSAFSGLNSVNLDFLPVQNIEEEVVVSGLGSVPVEERHNDQHWRGSMNGSESHTSSIDEYNARQFLCKDGVEAVERGVDKDKGVPSPSMGWFGSFLSLTFLSSNASSSSDLGCGAVEMLHQIGGHVYRFLKSSAFRSVVEGRAGVANFIRLLRVAFVAAHLSDIGERELKLPRRKRKQSDVADPSRESSEDQEELSQPTQPFVVCVNEILKKKGLTHTLFTRALQNLSGRIKEPQLLGTLVDAERHAEDPRTRGPFVDPEGFPNSYVRGSSLLYCRIGVQVESIRDSSSQTQSTATKGVQMQAYAEPVIPEGGIAFGGPITIRVVENEGSFREYVKDLAVDGSRRDWGATFLHAKPVTTAKAQTAASGSIESSLSLKETQKSKNPMVSTLDALVSGNAFTDTDFHTGGYQAIELIRLTNLTPLLWVRVDPTGQYGGKISVFQPDACLAEQLFHDGDAGAQIDAIRALAERPLRIQATGKVTTVYDVNVAELPVRVIGDCLRGSPALHSSLAHTPTVRVQAALAIAQWQNNKAPPSKDAIGSDNWVGINILIQYFRERFYSNSIVMPNKFSRLSFRKSDEGAHQATTTSDGGFLSAQQLHDATYDYLDTFDDDEMKEALESAIAVELEEDEEYRVRSAVVTAIACIRAKDGLSPSAAIKFLETVLESEDAKMMGNLVCDDAQLVIEETFNKVNARIGDEVRQSDVDSGRVSTLEPLYTFVPSMLLADALLATCHISASPTTYIDPATGKPVQSKGAHPLARLLNAVQSWLEWELYRENIRLEFEKDTQCGISGNCHDVIAASAVIALSNLAIQIQSTTDPSEPDVSSPVHHASSAKFYMDIFDSEPHRNDLTRAACAQAISCVCCAADRFEKNDTEPLGLLISFEFLLGRILDNRTSVSLRHTLALIMMDSCTGKICSMQRIGAIAGRNDLILSTARFFGGPLGSCHGGDNGSAVLMAVSSATFPAASAVNDGARRGMRLLSRAGHPSSKVQQEVVRVAIFATRLWRTINGEPADVPKNFARGDRLVGVCAYDGILRCSLLALWQWIWPKGCYALLQVQSWDSDGESTPPYRKVGADLVMKISAKEKATATAEENSLADLSRLVEAERDRQVWRGEMYQKAYELHKANKGSTPTSDVGAAEKGIGQPLPPIARDTAFRQGGWIASAAQQRRALALDGGTAVTKLRLKVKSADS